MTLSDWFRRPRAAARLAPLSAEHAARLADIHRRSFARGWSPADFEQLLTDRLVTADGLFLGPSREPAGFVLSRVIGDEAEILTVAVSPDHRGEGHARPLLTHHLDELARQGVRAVHLEVEEANAPALAVYRRLGFEEVGRRAGYYAKPDGTSATALTMRARL